MANISDARITKNITQNRRVIDMAQTIALIDPSVAPFLTILKRIKGGGNTRVALSPKIEWLEDDYVAYSTTLASAYTATATSMSVASGTGALFRVGDIVYIPSTGESVLVTAVSTDTLTVVPNFSEGTAVSTQASSGATVLIIGNASEENSTKRAALSTQEIAKFNYTQIFRTPCELSNTLIHSKLYGGKDIAYQRKKILAEHKMDIARAMYFGNPKESYADNKVRRSMGGLKYFIGSGSNTQAFSSGSSAGDVAFTWKKFNEYVGRPAFEHGSDEKLMLVGGTTAAAIDGWDIDKLITEVKGDTFGVHVKRLQTTYGVLDVVYDPLLDRCGHSDYGFILDLDKIRYAHLEGRDTKLNTNIQQNDQDGVIDEYITECSLEVKNPNAHFMFSGAYCS